MPLSDPSSSSIPTDKSSSITAQNRSPIAYFVLTVLISIPFWIAGVLTPAQLLPAVPISALGLLSMVSSASILVYRETGRSGVVALWQRSFDFHRVESPIWYGPTLLLMPCVMVASYGILRWMGMPLPVPLISGPTTLVLFLTLFGAAIGEELGWSGYAIDPLQERFGALVGALILGAGWAGWHVIPLLEASRSLDFIAWWSLNTLALRVLITWLYNNTGRSVFVAVLFHTMANLSWQLFPIHGSYFDPRVTGLITTSIAVVVVIGWGPKTLMRT